MTRHQLTAFIAVIALVAVSLLRALWNPVLSLIQASLFAIAALGIRRGDGSSALGAALLVGVPGFTLMAKVLLRGPSGGGTLEFGIQAGVLAIWSGVLVTLLIWAALNMRLWSVPGAAGWGALAIVLLAGAIVYTPFVIPTGSMKETLLIGDYILVREVGVPKPSRRDLVIVRFPADPKTLFAKRVIALGGDRVRLVNKKLLLNGVEQNEPYAIHKSSYVDAYRDNFPSEPNTHVYGDWAAELLRAMKGNELVIPPGKVFLLGDNRDESLDSRYWGYVDESEIVGQPALIYFSYDAPVRSLRAPAEIPWPPMFKPSTIRWERIFKVL